MSILSDADIRAAVALGHDLGSTLPAIDTAHRQAGLQRSEFGEGSTLDALLITNLINVRYLTGFTGSAGLLWVTADEAVFITDGRYAERAAAELKAVHCSAHIEIRRSVPEQRALLRDLVGSQRGRSVGLESTHVSWAAAEDYRSLFSDIDGSEIVATADVVEDFRRTKDASELARLARASAIADAALAAVLPLLAQRPTEVGFARALESAMADLGSHEPSFATIIAGGPNASRPHHEPSGRAIEDGDEIICDFGATVDGYHSDMTRTVYVGAPAMKQRRHFGVVQAAQRAGVDSVRAGRSGKEVDAACRNVIADAGWAEYFVHGTGHGSGLLIHEDPWAGPTSTSTLKVADILTVEPGVYLPGEGGVRIEDSLVVCAHGSVHLTRAPYDLVV
jgi:Xaa-Pro aminopeptidase